MAATTATTPPPLAAEAITSATVYPFPDELQGLTFTSHNPPNLSQPDKVETLPPAAHILPPLFINSIAELKDLSAAIASFQKCYEDLYDQLDSLKATVSSKRPPETPHASPVAPPSLPKPDASDGTVLQKQHQESNPLDSELERLCKTMCNRGIRKYLQTHLSDFPQLREEVPKALKLAPNPSRLVLESLGKLYFQRSGLIARHPTMTRAREVSNFMLECFLLMMGMGGKHNIDKAVKVESKKAALVWRNRLMSEGGLAKADQTDARGLLLFVACFGFPNSFLRGDIRDLLSAANAKEIVGVLRKSRLLMYKITGVLRLIAVEMLVLFRWHTPSNSSVSGSQLTNKSKLTTLLIHSLSRPDMGWGVTCQPDMVVGMLKNKREVDAVDLVYTFGLEERFNPQDILASYLWESKESWKMSQKGPQSSATALNEANKKQLAALKSIHRCLERHEIDPAKLLPEWQINEQITTLEKDINADWELGEITPIKRKSSETETPRKPYIHEPKRTRFISHGPRQLKTRGHADSRRNFSNRGPTNRHPNNYRASTPLVNGVHGGVMVGTGGPVKKRASNSYAWNRNRRFAGQSSSVSVGRTRSVEGFGGVPNASSVGIRSGGSDCYQFDDSVGGSESYPTVAAGPAHHSPYLYEG
ncbi:protein frigida [Phtheirospermum japonicum]|uniref:FRIGIDA-like protein n=1 Tax=Phtheirospermum japonicum TaxID=374723 RepID=A0A830BYE4_9LAMI|nr:protein frigida [Phtheirospermum japonicum]